MKQPLDAAAVARALALDDRVIARLTAYLDLLCQWQRRINLVGASTLADPWRRHILDAAQLNAFMPPGDTETYDLGSGAGIPGLVLAILGQRRVTLVDSDERKCAFLREAARLTETDVVIRCQRIETLPPACADVITARALKPLPELLALATPLLRPGGRCVLLKGAAVDAELTAAGRAWTMRVDRRPSVSDAAATVLTLREIAPR